MATLVFTALGTVFGGPLGGAIGALAGRQIDGAILGSPSREGSRLKELSVTTSSYGSPIPRQYGRVRTAGTIIWATDLVEHKETQGGGKGRPSITSYSYSASFAVALSSRPIRSVGLIWADGNLLRGAAGDLKTGGKLRIYAGHGDQPVDPLMAASEGAGLCPAYRGLAYVVFEDLQLADFGNRIPSLTFEIFTGEEGLTAAHIVAGVIDEVDAPLSFGGMAGLTCEGPPADVLGQIDSVLPLDCDVSGNMLRLSGQAQAAQVVLAEACVPAADDGFGSKSGYVRKRLPPPSSVPEAIRYYDMARDYQPGLQRASGPPRAGQPRTIELPAAMTAGVARKLIDSAARREAWGRQTLSWRTAEINPAVRPGTLARLTDQPGVWRVTDWEWRSSGVELHLIRVAGIGADGGALTDAGRGLPAPDNTTGATVLQAFEGPWDGSGAADTPLVYVAASSAATGWTGASLFLDDGDGGLEPLGPSSRQRSIMGVTVGALPAGTPFRFDQANALTVTLLSADMNLSDAAPRQLAAGANRALVGEEIIQFARATPLGGNQWRLEGLLRGRGGTEAAIGKHLSGECFIALGDALTVLDGSAIATAGWPDISAIGLADDDPVISPIACRGLTRRPLFPVHTSVSRNPDDSRTLCWTRRARGAWRWLDEADVPLNEQSENYEVLVGPPDAPIAMWSIAEPQLVIDAAKWAALAAAAPGAPITVRQRGSYAASLPTLITTLD